MPRNPTEPPLPVNPATWLANFRYRLAGENGERLSPEALGYQLGVSGATVRRWEAGLSDPNQDDLARFADVCRLSPHQREFVTRLFSRPSPRISREPRRFRQQVSDVLGVAQPACLMDELFFIRAWNEPFIERTGHLVVELPRGLNGIRLSLEVGKRSEPKAERLRVKQIVSQMWMWTAHVAGVPAYGTLVAELLKNTEFTEQWRGLIDGADDHAPPMQMPIPHGEGDDRFKVHLGELLFPPLYRVFIWQAGNEGSPGSHQPGKSEVYFANQSHWTW